MLRERTAKVAAGGGVRLMVRPLRTLVADDEPLALRLLCASIEACGAADIVQLCRNGREVVRAARELEPDLLVLDVEMPGMSGFSAVRALQADTLPLVIFVTAFSQYAVDAFEINAVDYVLKPIDDGRLAKAMQRATRRFAARAEEQAAADKGRIVDATLRIAPEHPSHAIANWQASRRIAVREGPRTEFLECREIVWVDAAGDYMCLHDGHGKTHVIRSTMRDLLLRIDDPRFVRVHRSTAVNLDRIRRARSLGKGEYRLTMRGGGVVKVSRSYRTAIREYLDHISV